MLHRVSIRIAAPLLIGVPVLVLGLWLSAMWYQQSRQAVHELAERNIDQIHTLSAVKVGDILSMPVRVSELNAHLIRSGMLDTSDLASWRETLVREAQAFDMLSAVSWGSADGRTAWVSRYSNGHVYWALLDDPDAGLMREWRLNEQGEMANADPTTFDFELASRPWYITPVEAGRPTWSEPYPWVGGDDGLTLGISYGIPIDNSAGEFLGVIDADYSLSDLSDFMGTLEIGKTGVAFLADADGELIATSHGAPVMNKSGHRFSGETSVDARISAAWAARNESPAEGELLPEIHVDGETHYFRSSSLGQDVGLDWTLITVIPERDFLADIETGFQHSALTSLLAVVAVAMLGILAARWLVAPLTTLVNAVREIGRGKLETRVSIAHCPEYNKLASEINAMAAGLEDSLRMRESLALAMEVQKNLLPGDPPQIRGLDIAGQSTYCDETGGDYYDFLEVTGGENDTVVLVVGDVMGHGVAAALLMATARGILRSRCAEPGSLADFLGHLNEMLVPDTRGERFMTMLLVTLSDDRTRLRWASAGHGPPLIYDPSTDSFPEMEGGELPLGLLAGEDYEEHVLEGLKPGAIILAATDGLWESKSPDGEIYGPDRSRELLRKTAHLSAAEISQVIHEELEGYRGAAGQDDDLTFVVAKIL
jgi:serine phosphatase RsbU (regulator of sigma subunit)